MRRRSLFEIYSCIPDFPSLWSCLKSMLPPEMVVHRPSLSRTAGSRETRTRRCSDSEWRHATLTTWTHSLRKRGIWQCQWAVSVAGFVSSAVKQLPVRVTTGRRIIRLCPPANIRSSWHMPLSLIFSTAMWVYREAFQFIHLGIVVEWFFASTTTILRCIICFGWFCTPRQVM